jgi:hypothetical protein
MGWKADVRRLRCAGSAVTDTIAGEAVMGTVSKVAEMRRVADGVGLVFVTGDVVRVRGEDVLSVVVLPTGYASGDGPGVWECCVPIALVRTPAGDEDGVRRWVQIGDLTSVGLEGITAGAGRG